MRTILAGEGTVAVAQSLALAGSAVGVRAGINWVMPEGFLSSFLRSQESAGLRYWSALCRAFILCLLASSLTELSRQVLRASFSPLFHFFQVLLFVQVLCDKRIPSKAHQLCAVFWAWGFLQLRFTFLRGSLCSKFLMFLWFLLP